MTDIAPAGIPGWRRSRIGLVGFWLVSLMVGWFLLRCVLFFGFRPSATTLAETLWLFVAGFFRDVLVALWLSLPLTAWLLLTSPEGFQRRWHRALFWTVAALFWSVETFLLFVEFFFFDEFKSRFNTVAVDYLLYPQEVFVNIWQSYHVGIVIAVCGALGIAWMFVAQRLFTGFSARPLFGSGGWGKIVAVAALAVSLAPLLLIAGALTGVITPRLRVNAAHISTNRTLNEIADNGAISFLNAVLTRNLDYRAFYKTLPREEAYRKVRELLSEKTAEFVDGEQSIRRRIAGDPARPKLNVVLCLEESLGSEFWGCLGRTNSLTPEMDKLAVEEGMLFTNLYASGNRTVRGMEGVLSSFPPLPGESIVKRDRSDNVETIARVLKRDGYSTLFLYGGRGLFDGMRSFAVRNGYDRFIEQKHFEHPTFTTIWGVCDEDLFGRTVEECRKLASSGEPFFATVLSVSNHKPFTYPKGRIAENPDERKRENAVKYSDFALGQFFRAAKKEAFWTNTIFVVVADHGARVYGEQSIPIHSYEIPLVIAGPVVVKEPVRIGQLGCSLDVAPTILGLLGRPYQTLFFGQDLLRCPPQKGRALLNHNRDIGMLAGERLVVLGLRKGEEFYAGDPKLSEMKPLLNPSQSDQELLNNAAAIYQVADDLYLGQMYRLDENRVSGQRVAP